MKDLYLMLYNFGFSGNVPLLQEQMAVAKELGFQGLELIQPMDAEVGALLDEFGMKVIEGQKVLGSTGELQHVERMQKHGVRYIVGDEGYNDRESTLRVAERLNALGKQCKPYGFQATTHNHTGEFSFNTHDGEYCWETLAKNTDPDLVSFKLDIGWATIAGVDCEYLIRKYAGRVALLHVKPATKILGIDAMNTRKLGLVADPDSAAAEVPSNIDEIMKKAEQAQEPMKDYVRDLQRIMETAEQNGAKAFILERDCYYTDRVPGDAGGRSIHPHILVMRRRIPSGVIN